MITAGIGGVVRHGCAALAENGRLLGVCAQERVTRVRGAGCNPTGLPDEALSVLLARLDRPAAGVERFVLAESCFPQTGATPVEHLDHDFAHAATAFLTSPFESATVLVCDEDEPKVSVWEARDGAVRRVEWGWAGPGFLDVYGRISHAFGFGAGLRDHRLEALARLDPDAEDSEMDALLESTGDGVRVSPALEAVLERRVGPASARGVIAAAPLAAAIQQRLGAAFLDFLGAVRNQTKSTHLVLGGSFFYHSWVNTLAKQARLFDDVFVPIDPGNGGLAVGAALHSTGAAARLVSPFQGPSYTGQEIKQTLDNCKLHYQWESEEGVIATAVRALKDGTLVGWFDGAMEWGPRALGARCILANPFAPYVLENLNRFLKHRDAWRGYALSGLETAVDAHFAGPCRAPFMECDYRPRDARRFAHVLPSARATIRVHTVGPAGAPRFSRLLEAFGRAEGLPFLVNTSFNGFHEPIVCSPRDAVRVFYGSGLDMLVIGQFILRK